ncbi:hypothetical protein [Enterococcus rivorum]|uniref:hypothetical protein n=1 Tax=Enterococcus rivorum TaxID=762845 RepID=UPI001B80A943|nr:hypothetical protein [Enterococcus rivorum]
MPVKNGSSEPDDQIFGRSNLTFELNKEQAQVTHIGFLVRLLAITADSSAGPLKAPLF